MVDFKLARYVLMDEKHAIRFEDFCIDLFSDVNQCVYVTTSRTWDLGKDGRQVTSPSTGELNVICCGTGDDPVEKAKDDLARLLENDLVPNQMLCCFTDASFSENKAYKIQVELRRMCSKIRIIDSFGLDQLADLCVRFPDAIQRHYSGEIQNARNEIASKSSIQHDSELTGLRVALSSQVHEQAQSRRSEIVQSVLLKALEGGSSLTLRKLSVSITQLLHLPKTVQESWMQLELDRLASRKLVEPTSTGYCITRLGLEQLKTSESSGDAVLAEGKRVIAEAIHELTGSRPVGDELALIWGILENGLVSLFADHGFQVVESVASTLTGENQGGTPPESLRVHIRRLADSVRAIPGKGGRIEAVAQAIEDMFNERELPVFEWLTKVAEVFLHLCTLGVQPAAQQTILSEAKRITICLDTDLILSLLSEAEYNHLAVVNVVRGWVQMGGQAVVIDSALEEASHHAWIAHRDFENVSDMLDSMTDLDSRHLIDNVFVRAFRFESIKQNEKCTFRRWNHFISAFRGSHDHDFRKLVEHLSEYGIIHMGEDQSIKHHATVISDQLYSSRLNSRTARDHSLKEKCDRDGRSAAFLLQMQNQLHAQDRLAVFVSTSRSIRKAIDIGNSLGASTHELVWYIGSVAWVLAQLPGVNLTANMLRSVLLDADFPARPDPLERTCLRILQRSEQYKIHYSRRPTLRRALQDEIRKVAIAQGIDQSVVEDQVVNPSEQNSAAVASIVAAAVDQIARSEAEKKLS